MMLTFLAPLFLGGIAFLGLPWLLHQIRRPEREPMSFSSLMFVPDIKKEVIERRRIQHILLMLLRMFILLLLVMAFSRPTWNSFIFAETPDAATWNLVLIDRSYSMQAGDHFQQAQNQAELIIDSLSSNDRVGLIAFDNAAEILQPLYDEVGTAESSASGDLVQIINDLEPTNQTTNYLNALQTANNEFLPLIANETSMNDKWIIHVISDFQANGLPQELIDWRLPEQVTLELHQIGNEKVDNVAITDHAIRETNTGDLQVVSKIRNSSTGYDREITASLFVNDENIQSSTLRITPGNSTQLSFWVPKPETSTISGYIELPEDDLVLDNRHYFTWNAPSKTEIIMISDADQNQTRTPSWFLSQAIPQNADLPWKIETKTSTDNFAQANQNVYLMVDINQIENQISSVLENINQGSNLFLILDESMIKPELNENLFSKLGFQANGLKNEFTRQDNFHLMSMINFDHTIFMPFKGAQYNDFSNLIFYNYIVVKPLDRADIKPITHFDSDGDGQGDLAIFETSYGEGNVIVWTFSPNLQQNNLVRSTKFIPLLYETLNYLDGNQKTEDAYVIGDSLRWPEHFVDQDIAMTVDYYNQEQNYISSQEINPNNLNTLPRFEEPGFISWSESEKEEKFHQAINIDPNESNLVRIPLDDFKFKFSSAPIVMQETGSEYSLDQIDYQKQQQTEYGYWLLMALFACFLVEMVYASRLL